jgi:hypothetical protein
MLSSMGRLIRRRRTRGASLIEWTITVRKEPLPEDEEPEMVEVGT